MDDKPIPAAKRKRRLWILIPVLLLAALSLVFLAGRTLRWSRQQEKTRLLTLVDREHPVQDDYNVEFTLLGDGQMVDSRCVSDLEELLADCRSAGGKPEIVASFRTWGAQELAWEQALEELLETGLDEAQARERLARTAEEPGYSEHQLGLAVDILEEACPLPPEQQEGTATGRWLQENAWRYGFILRYPANKTGVTGKDYRPWHYRYVGREAAEQIFRLDLSLEEYLKMFYA